MNLDPKNYVALLDSIIRTNPSLLDTIRTILKAYLKLDPYEDLLGQMPPKLQATLLYIIQDINDIENPFTLEQEVFFLLEHLNHVQHDIDGVIGAEDEGESEGGHDAKAVKPKKAKAKPAAVKKKPAAVKKKPAVVKKKPAVVKKKPAVVKKKPAAVKKKPAVVKKKPAVKKTKAAVKKKPTVKKAKTAAKKASAKKPVVRAKNKAKAKVNPKAKSKTKTKSKAVKKKK